MKTVLCFGDSNTWGSDGSSGLRFGPGVRWPGALQRLLGDEFRVIESGLGGRTTDLDDKGSDVRNGIKHLPEILKSQVPLDWLVIMLGTNDLKNRFGRTAQDVAEGVRRLVQVARQTIGDNSGGATRICILTPAPIDPTALGFERYYGRDFRSGYQKSIELPAALRAVAVAEHCECIDTSGFASVGPDGVHLTRASHQKIAEAVASMLQM